jgi:hypothetical protein
MASSCPTPWRYQVLVATASIALLAAPVLGTTTPIKADQKAALLEWYTQLTSGTVPWVADDAWTSDTEPCATDPWTGVVQCDNAGNVMVIDLAGYEVAGTVPKSFSKLTGLTYVPPLLPP